MEWEAKRKKEKRLRLEKEGLSLRFEGGANLGDDGVLGPEVGELLKCRIVKQHVPEEGER